MNYFESLPLEVQVEIIVDEGIHLGTSTSSIYQTDLYAIGGDLVEVLLLPIAWDFVHVRIAREAELEKYIPVEELLAVI